jgi:hypothetical protein
MEIAGALADGIGARLTGSPNMKRANDWTRDKLAEWGLANAHLESWGPFGRGWSSESVSVRMVSPDVADLVALPKAWSPGTNGPVRGKVVLAKLTAKKDLAAPRPGSADDAVGLPAFQFVQDDIEYESRTHHTNQDVYERLQRDDLMQAAVVMATFVWHAAMRDAKIPRKPLPKESKAPAAARP